MPNLNTTEIMIAQKEKRNKPMTKRKGGKKPPTNASRNFLELEDDAASSNYCNEKIKS